MRVSVGIRDILCARWTKNLNLVERLVMETRTWTLYFATPKYSDYMQHAILHDAARVVRLQSGKRFGYCYKIGRGPNCYLLCHVTGFLFCLHVKTFLHSLFNLIDFWSGMSLLVLDRELTWKNKTKKLGFFCWFSTWILFLSAEGL